MYLLIDSPDRGTGDTIQSVLEQVCEVYITKVGDEGFEVKYKFKYCYPSKSTYTYGNDWTEDEVRRDFYKNTILKVAKNNGYVLFKKVD